MKLGHTTPYRYRCLVNDDVRFKSRGDVIHWLNSLVKDGSSSWGPQPGTGLLRAGDTSLRLKQSKTKDAHLHKTSQHTTEFLWVGPARTDRKYRKHYGAYSRSGIKISVQDFVHVLAEEGKQLVAYLDDLYEDYKGNKMAVVQWLHKVDELGLDLPRNYNGREIFFSLSRQDLSIKCIDGIASVLSSQHYDNFLDMDVQTMLNPYVCLNLFDNEVVKPFDITRVKGYWNQNIHSFMVSDGIGIRPRKRLRRFVDHIDSSGLCGPLYPKSSAHNSNVAEDFVTEYKHEYTKGSEIELLSQDSGIRGMWFRGVVIKKHKDKLKVRYQDIKDAEDESMNLEEWILSTRVADDDQLGIRHSGRMKIRPSRLPNKTAVSLLDAGCIVDAWLHDGWCEGIVVHKESDDKIHVYFPGEKQKSIMGCKDLRYSEEWLGNEWKQMKSRPDLVGPIASATETIQSQENISSLSSGRKDNLLEKRELEVVEHQSKEDLLTRLTWNWSTKKKRCYASNNNDLVAVKRRKSVDNEGCKFICRPTASTLTNLVMSR
ncbi:Agenet-like domain-containing protein [Artemisia annua]|uniref:Agenet-like domain-containing protein n=1 Tax=Artemisia annua TaxID=35608 RepID=A0A2U1QBQ2_ARTAN|nr:Agenet-like domain-containing protein [Artemisia annua]